MVSDGDPRIEAIHSALRMLLVLTIGQQTNPKARQIMTQIAAVMGTSVLTRWEIVGRMLELELELMAALEPPGEPT